ncbi:hypothetical protein BUALT_Bualt04G0022900 [Buddleja alternifolia]|uniref:Protein kinase domain-containing protein n=1 Tax=Buddleja alternifolia TaxID=168488 RepID=A0AAV6XWK3_9LAMI|nr:hypothetical protein BUALT_Bualt04G0022900 [Buddleja alternifolia]
MDPPAGLQEPKCPSKRLAFDMWSAGCIFAELLHGKPILQGKNEIFEDTDPYLRKTLVGTSQNKLKTSHVKDAIGDKGKELNLIAEQLDWIYDLCGTPDEETWSGVSKFPCFDQHALDLLEKMLALDPAQGARVSA